MSGKVCRGSLGGYAHCADPLALLRALQSTVAHGRIKLTVAQQAKHKSYPFYLGGIAGVMAGSVTHPLDVAKVRMQTSGVKLSMLTTLSTAIRKEGIVRGAYPGLSASILRQLTYSMTRFGVYDKIKDALVVRNGGRSPSAWEMALAGCVAGGVGGIAGNPADIVLVRMISDRVKPAEQQLGYRNAIQGIIRMTRDEGPSSLFRGISPNVSRAVLMSASQLATYDIFKDLLTAHLGLHEGVPLHFSASFLAGTVATTVCSPFDVVKSRLMSSSGGAGVGEIVRTAFAKEGPMFMFRGWVPAWIRLAPYTILVFVFLEQLRSATDQLRARSRR